MLGGGDGQEKILLSEEGGHYMKNKNIGRGVLSTQPDQRKRPQCKMRKKCKTLSNIENFSPLVSLTGHFTKFIFLEQLAAMPQFIMQNMFFFFFLNSYHDTNPLLHLYHFRKKNIVIY